MKKYLVILALGLIVQVRFAHATELEQLAHDRPQILTLIQPGDELWLWLDSHFSNTCGCKVHWDNSAEWLKADPGQISISGWQDDVTPIIRIAATGPSGKPVEGGTVLVYLIFELLNLKHQGENEKLFALAWNGTIDQDEFVRRFVLIEFNVIQDLKKISKQIIEPTLKRYKRPIPQVLEWFSSVTDDPNIYWDQTSNNPASAGYLDHYRRMYKYLVTHKGEVYVPTPIPKREVTY